MISHKEGEKKNFRLLLEKQRGRSKQVVLSISQQNLNRTVAHIYVVSPAGPQSSVTGWATLGLSPSSGLCRSSVAPGPLQTWPHASHQICVRATTAIHIHISAISAPARNSGPCGFSCSPDPSLISRAVRIRAIRVEVKWTELSSAMGMFIFTNRWEEWKQRGGALNQEQLTNSSRRGGWINQSELFVEVMALNLVCPAWISKNPNIFGL